MAYYEDSRFMAASSFPKVFSYPVEENDMNGEPDMSIANIKPKIIIMGLRRSGKSSIQKVVFHKMSPNETLFLESTNKIVKDDISNNSFVSFSIWDFPGQINFFEGDFDFQNIFKGCGALVFVIDSQDDYGDALGNLNQTVRKAHQVNPNINFEVFIHKVDGLSDDHKIEARQEIHQRANEDLFYNGEENILLSFYLTSIYDHSIFEAFSKVVQKLIPQLPILENLLNVFISNSGIEKAFLFDVVSKIFIATDSSPVDMQSYELCCDMIDVVIDISCIYGIKENGEGSTFDHASSASIRLKTGTVLYLREVNKFLALVCILREENFSKQGLIDYNFQCFRQSIQEVFNQRLNDAARLSNTNFSTPYGSSNAQVNEDNAALNQVDLESDSFHDNVDSMMNLNQHSSDTVSNNLKQTSSPQLSNNFHHQSHRKNAILPSTSTPSSLPNHQSKVAKNQSICSPNIFNSSFNNVSVNDRRPM